MKHSLITTVLAALYTLSVVSVPLSMVGDCCCSAVGEVASATCCCDSVADGDSCCAEGACCDDLAQPCPCPICACSPLKPVEANNPAEPNTIPKPEVASAFRLLPAHVSLTTPQREAVSNMLVSSDLFHDQAFLCVWLA